MEVKVNDYIKLVEDLDCGLAELPRGMVFKVVKVNDRMTTILNELIGGGGFSKAEINEFFEMSTEEEYSQWITNILEERCSEIDEDEGGLIMKTSRNDGVIISTVAPSFLAWYGEYETAVSIDGKPWRIARGYETLEEAIEGHDRFSSMSKEELMNYKYIG